MPRSRPAPDDAQSSLLPNAAPAPLPQVDYGWPLERSAWNGLVLVGEAPGADEVRLGQPFVGRSGQLLNTMLVKAGIDRSRSLVANVFRFQPPGNKVDHFFTSRRAAAQQGCPIAEEYGPFGSAWCRGDFSHEIKHLGTTLTAWKPRLVVALGRTPFWALTGQNGLLAHVGQTLDCRLLPGTPVLPTFHPSFILRGNWKLQDEWLRHFVAAAQ